MSERTHAHTPNCFRVWRDGRWLKTRTCNLQLRREYTAEAERLAKRREMWLGKKESK